MKLRISHKIHLISGTALIGFLLVAVIILTSEDIRAQKQNVASAASEEMAIINEARYEFLNVRRREKDFLLRFDEGYVSYHHAILLKIEVSIADFIPLLEDTQQQEMLKNISRDVESYRQAFSAVVASWRSIGLSESEGLRGEVRSAVHDVEQRVHDVEQRLTTLGDDFLTITMLMMRRAEKDFLARIDPRYLNKINQHHSDFRNHLSSLSVPAGEREDILKKMEAYTKNFNKLADLRLRVDAEETVLSDIFARIDPIFLALFSQISAQAENA